MLIAELQTCEMVCKKLADSALFISNCLLDFVYEDSSGAKINNFL